jgi:hypothetical protein
MRVVIEPVDHLGDQSRHRTLVVRQQRLVQRAPDLGVEAAALVQTGLPVAFRGDSEAAYVGVLDRPVPVEFEQPSGGGSSIWVRSTWEVGLSSAVTSPRPSGSAGSPSRRAEAESTTSQRLIDAVIADDRVTHRRCQPDDTMLNHSPDTPTAPGTMTRAATPLDRALSGRVAAAQGRAVSPAMRTRIVRCYAAATYALLSALGVRPRRRRSRATPTAAVQYSSTLEMVAVLPHPFEA